MEMARGLITITFAFLIFLLRGYSIKLLIYALGFYLIIDGCVDIYKVATGKRISQHKFHHYLGSTISVVVGIISFVLPSLTIILLAWMMAIRVIIRGIRVFNDALLRWRLFVDKRTAPSLCPARFICVLQTGFGNATGFARKSSCNYPQGFGLRPAFRSNWLRSYCLGL